MSVDDFSSLDTTCDGLFLLLDTREHNGCATEWVEIQEHILGCWPCFERNYEVVA